MESGAARAVKEFNFDNAARTPTMQTDCMPPEGRTITHTRRYDRRMKLPGRTTRQKKKVMIS